MSKLFQCCFLNVEATPMKKAQLSFSTKYKSWNNINSSTLNQRNSFSVVSTLLHQRWNNVDKHTSAQLSFSTKYQRWNNVDKRWQSTLFQRWINVDVFAGMFKNKLLEFSINTNWTELVFFDNASFHALLIHS